MSCEKHIYKGKASDSYAFYCKKCKGLNFGYRPLGDKVFMLKILPTKFNDGIIEIPLDHQQYYAKDIGIILAIGRGYYKQSGQFVSTQLKAGDVVYYDNSVPYEVKLDDADGKEHKVLMCGERDIFGLVDKK